MTQSYCLDNYGKVMVNFQKTYKVYINHTDAGGIVYHANHLVFFENCRRDWLTTLDYDGYFLSLDDDANTESRKAVHFVVSHADITYHTPLLVDDELAVTVDEVRIRPASLMIHQSIYRPNQNKPATTATITLACVINDKKTIRPHRLPKKFVQTLISATAV